MARNVEIKARVSDLASVEGRVRELAREPSQDLVQDDTFFACPAGRLKLRELSPHHGQLIFYQRPDAAGPKVSDYWISETTAPATLRETLTRALGVTGRVRKHRRVYLVDRTRVHLDQVEGLGAFVELEVVLREDEAVQCGMDIAHELLRRLAIDASQLVEGAYADLA